MQSLWGDDHTCGTKYIRKNGTTSAGAQRYRCTKCGRSATVGGPGKGYDDDFKRMVVQATREMSIRDVATKFDISPTTVIKRRRELEVIDSDEHQHDAAMQPSDQSAQSLPTTTSQASQTKEMGATPALPLPDTVSADHRDPDERGDGLEGAHKEESFDDRIAKLRAKLPERYDPTRGKKQQKKKNIVVPHPSRTDTKSVSVQHNQSSPSSHSSYSSKGGTDDDVRVRVDSDEHVQGAQDVSSVAHDVRHHARVSSRGSRGSDRPDHKKDISVVRGGEAVRVATKRGARDHADYADHVAPTVVADRVVGIDNDVDDVEETSQSVGKERRDDRDERDDYPQLQLQSSSSSYVYNPQFV